MGISTYVPPWLVLPSRQLVPTPGVISPSTRRSECRKNFWEWRIFDDESDSEKDGNGKSATGSITAFPYSPPLAPSLDSYVPASTRTPGHRNIVLAYVQIMFFSPGKSVTTLHA